MRPGPLRPLLPAARRLRAPALLVALVSLGACDPAGCGPAPSPAPGDDAGTPAAAAPLALRIEPDDVLLETDGETRPSQAFAVTLTLDDGNVVDASYGAWLTVEDPGLGSFTNNVFTSTGTPGETRVVARYEGLEVSARLRVQTGGALFVPPPEGAAPLPESPETIVEGAPVDEDRAPTIVYPADGVLLPPNLRGVELQFTKGSERNELFAVRFTSEGFSLRVYMRCEVLGSGCVYVPDAHVWGLVTAAHQGGAPVAITVAGTDDEGRGAGASAPVSISFASTPLSGGLYYWTTSNTTAIMRVDFTSEEQLPETFFSMEDGSCIGCHAISPDGRRMTLSGDSNIGDGRLMLLDVAEGTVLVSQDAAVRERFQSWDPTSSFFAAVYGAEASDTKIRIRDGTTAALRDEIDIGAKITHPEWAPSGDRIYFTAPTLGDSTKFPLHAGLSFVEQDEAGAWSAPQVLVPAEEGKNRYYPAASPDGTLVAFNESDCIAGLGMSSCDAVLDPTATLWAVAADGGTPVLLERADAAGAVPGSAGSTSSFPKWAPFVSASRDSERVLWLSFASRRKAGFRNPGESTWLWMAAVDPARVLAGEDGSYTAFVLPLQDFDTSNHVAQWTEEVVKPD